MTATRRLLLGAVTAIIARPGHALKTAKALGFSVPRELLLRADGVIE